MSHQDIMTKSEGMAFLMHKQAEIEAATVRVPCQAAAWCIASLAMRLCSEPAAALFSARLAVA